MILASIYERRPRYRDDPIFVCSLVDAIMVLAGDVCLPSSAWVINTDGLPEVLVIQLFKLPVTVVTEVNRIRFGIRPIESLRNDMMLLDIG